TFDKLLFRELSLCNIEYHALPAKQLAVAPLDKATAVADPQSVTVLAYHAIFKIDALAVSHRVACSVEHVSTIVGVHNAVPDIAVGHPLVERISKRLEGRANIDRRVRRRGCDRV